MKTTTLQDPIDPIHVFSIVLELEPETRPAYLEQLRGQNPEMADQIEAMLQAHGDAGVSDFLALTSMEQGHVHRTSRPHPERIGRYRIIGLLGEGGMGVVYAAEAREPIRRRVALKIIKVGMDTKAVVARFEAERQALALMDHACVAKVLDAGATDTGRPYFVMEHVAGVPITEHCDRQRLSIEDRLRLFMRVCDAVQHAHQKGIIHRDLKPSNILVSAGTGVPGAGVPGAGVPKVIDFGVAKALHQKLTEQTLFTEQGQLIGTPEYMSPEQAERTAQDIDTRSDIYSLGVLLYELLTGERPFPSGTLRQAGLAEIQRIIREEEPSKPSTRLGCLGDASAARARARRSDPRTLARRLRGDLDWIVMRAMEKDRTRRYATANDLAADLRRCLSHEPVQAGPPGATYRIGKFVRRHRGGVVAAALVVIVLLAGITGTTWGLFSARNQARLASDARDELEQVAEFQAAQLSGIDVPLMAMRLRADVLAQARAAWERSGLARDELDDRSARLETLLAGTSFTDVALSALDGNVFEGALLALDDGFQDQPLLRARLLHTVAETMAGLGLLDRATVPQAEALEIRRRLLGNDHPDTLHSINDMGVLLKHLGRFDEAELYYQEAVTTSRRVHGDEHPNTLISISNMGSLLKSRGKLLEAEPYYREALDVKRRVLGDGHPSTLTSISKMGSLLLSQGKPNAAERYFREALDGRRRTLGDDHPSTLSSISSMGSVLTALGNLTAAEPCFVEALDGRRRALGNAHPATLSAITNMAGLLRDLGRLDEAEACYREALDGYRGVFGDDHPDTLNAISNMAVVLQGQGSLAEAEPYAREALVGNRRVLGDTHPLTLTSISSMAALLRGQGKLAEAEPYYREALSGRRQVLGNEHWRTLASIGNMGRVLIARERFAEAEPLLQESLATGARVLGTDHWRVAEARSLLGAALAGQQRFGEAEPLLLDGHAGLKASLPAGRRARKLPPATERLVRLYESWDKPDQAAAWRALLESSADDASDPGPV